MEILKKQSPMQWPLVYSRMFEMSWARSREEVLNLLVRSAGEIAGEAEVIFWHLCGEELISPAGGTSISAGGDALAAISLGAGEVRTDADISGEKRGSSPPKVHSAAFPVEGVGVLELIFPRPRYFSEPHVPRIRALVEGAARYIGRMESRDELERENRCLAGLLEEYRRASGCTEEGLFSLEVAGEGEGQISFRWVNPAFASLTGVSADSLVGQGLEDVIEVSGGLATLRWAVRRVLRSRKPLRVSTGPLFSSCRPSLEWHLFPGCGGEESPECVVGVCRRASRGEEPKIPGGDMRQLNREILRAEDPRAMLERTVESLRRQMDCPWVCAAGRRIAAVGEFFTASGQFPKNCDREELLNWAFSEAERSAGGSIHPGDIPGFPAGDESKPEVCVLCFPLRIEKEQFGVLLVGSRESEVFEPEVTGFLEDVAEDLAWSLDGLGQSGVARRVAYRDGLTGVYNRLRFRWAVDRVDREEYLPISLIVADLNDLKMINDAFGHETGDRYLRAVADILSDCAREKGEVFRWGGDEFVVLLARTGIDEARGILQEVKRRSGEQPGPVSLGLALGLAAKTFPGENFDVVFADAESLMYRDKLARADEVREAIIETLTRRLNESGFEPEEHINRVKKISRALGERLDLDGDRLKNLELLAEFHDLGKAALPDEVLSGDRRLSDEGRRKLESHPAVGFRIAEASGKLRPIARAILAHHERYNGSGYPLGLREEEIPLLARIVAAADAYDCMRRGVEGFSEMSHWGAMGGLMQGAGTRFDPRVVRIFHELYKKKPPS